MPLLIVREDITKMRVDAIVNTTNEDMIGYSGVDLAVHSEAGEELDAECRQLAPLGVGMAVMTKGYRLPAKHIIHTSGPVYVDGLQGESVLLRSCYMESLKLASDNGMRSIAFPLISSGAYGYPKDQVLRFAVKTIGDYLENHDLTVYLCVFDRESYAFSKALYDDICAFIDSDIEREVKTFRERKCFEYGMIDADADACLESRGVYSEEEEPSLKAPTAPGSAVGKTLEEYLRLSDRSFSETLLSLIDERGMSDVECYKRANVDKRVFSKIRSNKNYRPSKATAIAFAIALKLDMDGTQKLLATAGHTLSRAFVFDNIIRYFIQNGNYNIFEINEALFEFDQTSLGAL